MSKPFILVVDDEEDILELVKYNLEKDGYAVGTASSGEEALLKARAEKPDLIILDLMLPNINGLDVCKTLKAEDATAKIPIIMLTAKGEDADIVTGLELGADDYVVKPFSPRVLIARIRAVLRRHSAKDQSSSVVKVGDLEIDTDRHEVTLAQNPISLTATEFAILHFMARRPGWVFTRNQIIDGIRGGDYPVTERSVDVQIVALRKKLEGGGDVIETVRGIGYRMREEN